MTTEDKTQALSEIKRKLMAQWQKGKGNSKETIPYHHTIAPHDRILSHAQQRLWYLQKLSPQSTAYNMYFAYEIKGKINLQALTEAFQFVIDRHDILRTQFCMYEGQPIQRVLLNNQFSMPIIDLRAAPNKESFLRTTLEKESQHQFDLENELLFRVTLYRMDEDKWILFLNMHHIISDGWSLGVLVNEINMFYESASNHTIAKLDPLPIQYLDFTLWQHDFLKGKRLQAMLDFWQIELQNAPNSLRLPIDHKAKKNQIKQGARCSLRLSHALTSQLHQFSKAHKVTLFTVLLSALRVLLFLYTRQEDFIIGTPVANRNRSELEPMVGFFVNVLPLRQVLSPDMPFINLLEQEYQAFLKAYDHQDLPFEILVKHLLSHQSLSDSPLFNVLFVLQNMELPDLCLGDTEISSLPIYNETAKYDLLLTLMERDGCLQGAFEFDSSLFSPKTIQNLEQVFCHLIPQLIDQPQQTLRDYRLLSAEQEQQTVRKLTEKTEIFVVGQTLVEGFEAQAKKHPNRIAVCDGDKELSYATLSELSNQLSCYLLNTGVARGDLVALFLQRSSDVIIAILGVLKAGGAYVPIDPNYPQERVQFIINDAEINVLITNDLTIKPISYEIPCQILSLDSLPEGQTYSVQPLRQQPAIDDLAYVIYTSGSTGLPKGVLVEHRQVMRLFLATHAQFNFTENDIWTLFHSVSFDFSVWEIWGALLYGGKLVVVSDETRKSPEQFYQLLRKESITVLNQTLSSFRQFITANEIDKLEPLENLRYIIFGGEALHFHDLKPWFNVYGELRPKLINMYGITETTVHVTYREIKLRDIEDSPGSMIGYPISDLQVFCCDEHKRLVPANVIGEMYVAGAGIARAYLNRSELTHERFIQDKRVLNGLRVYKTGDLGRYLSQGELEYCGRIDKQVKIRGYRIELGEIESLIKQVEGISNCVVIVQGENESRHLIAYYTFQHNVMEKEEPASTKEQDHWREVFDSYYDNTTESADPSLNIAGWLSSFTEKLIPAAEMKRWVEETVQRILALNSHPQTLLEIGCGTGMLLARMASHCDYYIGTDFSLTALEYVKKNILPLTDCYGNTIELYQCEALSLQKKYDHQANLIVSNSVIQYFPSVKYLYDALRVMINAAAEGSCLFLGDLRSLALQRLFHSSVLLYQYKDAGFTVKQWQEMLEIAIARDHELLIDPRFFYLLEQEPGFERIKEVNIFYKNLPDKNEMSLFRYDVILYLDHAPCAKEIQVVNYHEGNDEHLLSRIEQYLLKAKQNDLSYIIKGFPHLKLRSYFKALEYLEQSEDHLTLSTAFKESLLEYDSIDIFLSMRSLVETYQCHFTCIVSPDSAKECALMICTHPAKAVYAYKETFSISDSMKQQYAYRKTAIDPTHFAVQIKEALKQQLPDYMVPTRFVYLEKIPVTVNGKIDYHKLPQTEVKRQILSTHYQPPTTPTQEAILKVFSKLLDLDDIGIHDDFFELGGHSLLAVRLMLTLQEQFSIKLPLQIILTAPTVQKLSEHIDAILAGQTLEGSVIGVNLDEEVSLPHICEIPIQTQIKKPEKLEAVLLTGATGFVGAFLMRALLLGTGAQIYCLVRAQNEVVGLNRLIDNMKQYGIWKDHFRPRITILAGHLEKEFFGLGERVYNKLTHIIQTVYHNAAVVNFFMTYSALKQSNVLGTHNILTFCLKGTPKPLEYISTLHVFSNQDALHYGKISETSQPQHWQGLPLGYTQSKWVCERVLELARSSQLPIHIYRLGRISGDSKTGACQVNDYFWQIVKVCLKIGVFPDITSDINLTPVDDLARAVVGLSLDKNLTNRNFHMLNPQLLAFSDFVQYMRTKGYVFDMLPYEAWLNIAQKNISRLDDQTRSILPLLAYLKNDTHIIFDAQDTIAEMALRGLTMTEMTESLLDTYFSYFWDIGFLDRPDS